MFDFATATTTGVTLPFRRRSTSVGTSTARWPDRDRFRPSNDLEGASQSGRVYRLNISNLNMTARDYTVFMVVRPTTSTYRTQGSTPDRGLWGTYFSLEGAAPVSATGTASTHSNSVTSITPTTGVAAGKTISTQQCLTFTAGACDYSAFALVGGTYIYSFQPRTATVNTAAISAGAQPMKVALPLATFYATATSTQARSQ